MDWIIEFLKIPSVAAFIGALSAFLLVILNDWRRKRRKKAILYQLIKINKQLAQKKWETVNANLGGLREYNKVNPAPIMRFLLEDVRRTNLEVLDLLCIEEKLSIDALCYTMEAIDILIRQTQSGANKLISLPKESPDRISICDTLINNYNDILVNLKRFIDMSGLFINKKFNTILIKDYRAEDYL